MTTTSRERNHEFKHIDLRLVVPPYESEITDLIMHLEYLRKLGLSGTTPKQLFFQIKDIFHTLESIGSARIEGNRTTVMEYIDKKIEDPSTKPDAFNEIKNMEESLRFIEEHIPDQPIDRAFISQLHKIVVKGLAEEGSQFPGDYRQCSVTIRGSALVPPPPALIPTYMDELFAFVNHNDPQKYDLIKSALSHHRFVWIHPFDNGNGRTVRLLTYALLVKFGFNIQLASRILNPTAIFCADREKYYRCLSRADQGDDEGLMLWTEYMLAGLKRELEKTDKLADYDYLEKQILSPAITYCREKNIINENESMILQLAITKMEIANADIRGILVRKDISEISRMIRALLDKGFLSPTTANKRKYIINFEGNPLVRGIVYALGEAGFLPDNC